MEADGAVGEAAEGGGAEDGVPGPGGEGGEAGGVGEVGNQASAQGDAVGVVVALEEFGFEFGDIDVGGALGLAAFAGEAEVHDLFDFVGGERAAGVGRVGEEVAEDVGAGAGGVLFFAGGHVAGAHGAAAEVGFAAVAGAVAFLGGAEDAHDAGEIEDGLVVGRGVAGAVAMGGIHRRGVDDLAGVEQAGGVEEMFDRAHELVALVADHEADELAAQAAVAVFAGEGAAVFFDEGGDVGRDGAKHGVANLGLEVEQGAGVELAAAGVGVVNAADAVFVAHEGVEFADVGRQVGDGDGGVLDDLGGADVADDVGHDALAGAAEIPDAGDVVVVENWIRVAEAGGAEIGDEGGEHGVAFGAFGAADLDDEDGAGVALDEEAIAGLLEVGLGAVEDMFVDEFAGRRAVAEGDEVGVEGFVNAGEVGAEQGGGGGEGLAVEFKLDAEEEGALGAGDEAAEVEGAGGGRVERGGVHEQVEGVAGVAALDFGAGEMGGDGGAMGGIGEEVAQAAVEAGFEGVGAGALGGKFVGSEGGESDFGAVGEEAAGGDEVFAGGAVNEGVGAAGVIAHHAADHGAVGGGGFGAEAEAVGGEGEVEVVADDAGFYAHAAGDGVDGKDAVEVAAEVHDEAGAHDLAGEGGAGGARDEAEAVGGGEGEQGAEIGLGAGEGDGGREFLVFGGVGGVEAAEGETGMEFAVKAGGEGGEVGGGGHGGPRGARNDE